MYNREKYIIRLINSIRSQNFKDLEIIFIDDSSNDNSCHIIEKVQKKDENIILIKNKKNRGTFISRNLGVLISKGEYLIVPDSDDILSENIIDISYYLAKKYDFEIIRYNIYLGNKNIFLLAPFNKFENRPIYQPELSTYLFYGSGKLKYVDFNISNKFIKREAFIKALNYINKYYLTLYMLIYEDGLMNFILYRTVKSMYFKKKIGYYYIKNASSISISNSHQISETQILKFIFIYYFIILL